MSKVEYGHNKRNKHNGPQEKNKNNAQFGVRHSAHNLQPRACNKIKHCCSPFHCKLYFIFVYCRDAKVYVLRQGDRIICGLRRHVYLWAHFFLRLLLKRVSPLFYVTYVTNTVLFCISVASLFCIIARVREKDERVAVIP